MRFLSFPNLQSSGEGQLLNTCLVPGLGLHFIKSHSQHQWTDCVHSVPCWLPCCALFVLQGSSKPHWQKPLALMMWLEA